nr:hypothetical protein [Tanacetum cinerariifolium]
TSLESDVDTKNVDNHFMDFDHDPKVQPNVAGNKLTNEEDQQFSLKNLDVQQEALEEPNVADKNLTDEDDQQFFAKNLDVQLGIEEIFAVEPLCSLIDFDFPKEQMHYQSPTEPMMPEATVQGRNNGETTQSIITEYESQDLGTLSKNNVDSVQGSNDAKAIHDQLDTLSMKNVDSVQGYNDAKGSFGMRS